MKRSRALAFLLVLIVLVQCFAAYAEGEIKATFSVTAVTPYDGAKEISPVNMKMNITFSEAVDVSTLNMSNISVSGGIYGGINMVDECNAVLYFKRSEVNLGGKYTVTFKPGITAKSGASLEEKKVTFTVMKKAPQYRQITNGDFSDTANIYGEGGDTVNAIEIKYDGDNPVLEFTPGWNEAAVKQRIYWQGGRTYKASVRVKTFEAQKVWLVLTWTVNHGIDYYHDGQRNVISAGEWTTIEHTWTIPENADIDSDVYCWIAAEKAGYKIQIDDWNFYEDGFNIEPPSVAAGGQTDGFTYVSETTDNIEKIKAFGLVSKGGSGQAVLKRMDIVNSMLAVLGFDGTQDSGNIGFEDVPESDIKKVSAVYKLGLMQGYSDKEFAPNGGITVDETLKVLLSLMGWSDAAQQRGGYPNGYRSVAAELGLTKNLSVGFEAPLTYGIYAGILDNALQAEVLCVREFSSEKSGYTLERGDTMMDVYFGYASGSGIVEGTEYSSLYKNTKIGKNQVCIGGVIYECDADLSEYLGYKIKYYTEKDKNGTFDRLVYVCGMSDLNRVAEFSTFDSGVDYSSNTYTVSAEGEKDKKYRVTGTKKVVYNGDGLTAYTESEELFVPEYGTVKLIDSGSGFDTVVITNRVTMAVAGVDYEKKILYGLSGEAAIELGECEKLIIEDSEGSEYSIQDIKSNDVVSVIQNADKTQARVYVSSKQIEGTVCGIKKAANSFEIAIGDNFYGSNLRQTLKTVNGRFAESDINMSAKGTFYVDYRDRIAYFSYDGAMSVGGVAYLINAKCTESVSPRLMIKIYDINDKIVTLTAASNLRIDKSSVKSAEIALEKLKKGTSEVVSQLILYKLNDNGEVSFIDTAYNKQPNCADYRTVIPENGDNAEGFRITYSSVLPPNSVANPTPISFNAYARNFSNKIQLSKNPVIFLVPLDAKGDDSVKFRVIHDYWDLGDMVSSNVEAYQVGGNSLLADYLVVFLDRDKYTTNHLSGYDFGVVREITTVLRDEMAVKQVELVDGRYIYTENEEYLSEAGPGDWIRFYKDRNGTLISAAEIRFDASEKNVISGVNPEGGINDYNRMFFANVYEKCGTELKILNPLENMNDADAVASADIVSIETAKVYVYNSKKNTVENGTMGDIQDYLSAGTSCTPVMLISQTAVVHTVIVIK